MLADEHNEHEVPKSEFAQKMNSEDKAVASDMMNELEALLNPRSKYVKLKVVSLCLHCAYTQCLQC